MVKAFRPARLGADYLYVLPGFFVSLFAFVVLIPLTALSLGTLVIWIGALLLPLALTIASGFAELSRARLRHWGGAPAEVVYAPVKPGIAGFMRRMLEPRRWLDLVFETLVAFPLRTFTFVVAVAWTAGALGGITFILWGVFLPGRGIAASSGEDQSLPGLILEAMTEGAAPDWLTRSFALEVAFNLALGVAFLLTLPLVMRGLARLDAAAVGGGLGSATRHAIAVPSSAKPRTAPDRDGDGGRVAHAVSSEGWAWIGAAAVSVASIAINWPVLAVLYDVAVLPAMYVSLAAAAALLIAVRRPLLGIVVQAAATLATVLFSGSAAGLPWPWPVAPLIVQGFLVLLIALRNPWPIALAAWGAPQLAALVPVIAIGPTPGDRVNLIVCASITFGLCALGVVMRQLLRSRGALQDERRASADLSAQREELAERNRIAQELHDVVAHSMSVISVQATTAKYRLPEMDPASAEEFASIADSSRRALTEMRGLLAILRSNDQEVPLAPQPALGDIPELIDATRRSGARISFRTNIDDGAGVPSATALTAYRIVQEALSNAVRHSPGSEVEVAVSATDERLTLDVVNGPPSETEASRAAPGAGLGLAGVRERTAALGGDVEAGPTGDGGFRLRADLPLG